MEKWQNVWQAACGERSKNFLIHQRTHLGLGQFPNGSQCACVCLCVLVCESATNAKTITKTLLAARHPTATAITTTGKNTGKKSKPNVENVASVGEGQGRGRGSKSSNFLLGTAVFVFFYRLLPSFLLSCFHCHVKSAKKQNKRVGGKEGARGCEREKERERQQQGETLKFT